MGGRRYYPGKITAENADGTYAVAYDDGERERRVRRELIKVVDDGGSESEEAGFSRGERVEAQFRGKPKNKFYKGTISRVRADGTYDVTYDDGDKDLGLKATSIRSLEKKAKTSSSSRKKSRSRSRGRSRSSVTFAERTEKARRCRSISRA